MNSSAWSGSILRLISNQPLLERLFFASLELVALVLLLAVVVRFLRHNSPRLKALLWLLVLAKPIVSLAVGAPWHVVEFDVSTADTESSMVSLRSGKDSAATVDADGSLSQPGSLAMRSATENQHVLSDRTSNPSSVYGGEVALALKLQSEARASVVVMTRAANETWIMRYGGRLAVCVWGAGLVLFVLRAMIDRIRLRRLIAGGHVPNTQISARYHALSRLSAGRHAPRVIVTDDLESPALIGVFTPVILIPAWLAANNVPRQLDWALRHELMHWKLRDPLSNFVRELAQILFFFHPAAWWTGRKWEEAAELACDRAIVTDESDSRDYAEQLYGMLVQIRDRRRLAVASGLFATRTQIGRRIAALVNGPYESPAHPSALAVAVVLLLSVATMSIGGTFAGKTGQSAETVAASEASSNDLTLPVDSRAGVREAIASSPFANFAGAAVEPTEGDAITLRPASDKIVRALGTSTSVEYREVPLMHTLELLAKYYNIEVRVDGNVLKAANISIDGKVVTLRLRGVSLRSVLNLILEPESLGYIADGDQLVVTSREKAGARIEETAYDLHDTVRAGVLLADLGEAIVQTVGRGTWDQPGGAARWRVEGTKLILRQRADVQRHMKDLLVDVQRALVAVPGVFEDHQLELKAYPIADLRKGVSDSDLGNWLREALLVETSPENVGLADLKIDGDQMLLKQPAWVHAATAKYFATIRERGKREPTRRRTRDDFSFAKGGLQAEALRQIVKKQLAKPISASFQELGVEDVLTYLSEASGVPCIINKADWKKRGVSPDSPITFKAVNEPLAALIDKALTGLAVDWHVAEPGLILVAPQGQGAAALEPRAYGIQELCDRGYTVEGLMSQVKDVEHGSWIATGGLGTVHSLSPGLLIVSQTPRIHDQIDKLLDKLAPVRRSSR